MSLAHTCWAAITGGVLVAYSLLPRRKHTLSLATMSRKASAKPGGALGNLTSSEMELCRKAFAQFDKDGEERIKCSVILF